MDSIKTLMEKCQFDLVIKLTENATDPDTLFYRIGALLGKGKGNEALACLEKNQITLQKRMAFLIKVHIDLLCILGRYDDAFNVLGYYRTLPYESQEVEEILREMPKYIRSEEKAELNRKELTDEEIRIKLKSTNKNEILEVLNLIRNRDLNAFIEEFQNILFGHPFQAIRSYTLMVLSEKHIDHDFKFMSNKGLITVNPSKLGNPFDKDFQDIASAMTRDFKNPSLSDNAINILSSYIIQIYPDKMNFEKDYVIGVLYYLSSNALQVKDLPNKFDYCLNNDLSIDRFNEIFDDFAENLSKF